MISSIRQWKEFIMSDLYRYESKDNCKSFIKSYIINEGFRYSFWLRTNNYLGNIKGKFFLHPIYLFSKLVQRRLKYKFGIQIHSYGKIDKGLYIIHYSGIFINGNVVIGKNFTISQGVSIGVTNRGLKKGNPNIGDNVYVGPGATIIGNVTIGNDVAIGANAVVTKDLPPFSVAVGVPAMVISYAGSEQYVNNRI